MPKCPYYQKAGPDWGYPLSGYCGGYRSGKLRVPTLAELRTHCTCDCYSCPVYQYRKMEESERKDSSAA